MTRRPPLVFSLVRSLVGGSVFASRSVRCQSINQSINLASYQSVNQSTNQASKQAISQPISEPIVDLNSASGRPHLKIDSCSRRFVGEDYGAEEENKKVPKYLTGILMGNTSAPYA